MKATRQFLRHPTGPSNGQLASVGIHGCLFDFFVLFALVFAPCALADGVVTDCTEANLRAAMADGGTVTFACDGTIILSNALAVSADTVLVGSERSVTISGNDTTSIFTVSADRRLTLLNLTIANGRSTNGGAIWSEGGMITASNCVFSGNSAIGTTNGRGGAIFNNGGAMNLMRCVFADNQAFVTGVGTTGTNGVNGPGGTGGLGWSASGGAIWNSGSAWLEDCYFIRNRCTGGTGGTGGLAGYTNPWPGGLGGAGGKAAGGAVYHLEGVLRVTGCAFVSNSVTGGSGGMGGPPREASGGQGGPATGAGVHAEAGAVFSTNSTWFSNRSAGGAGGNGADDGDFRCSMGSGGVGGTSFGGSIFAGSAAVFLSNNTLAQNAADGGSGGVGGLGHCGPDSPSQVRGPYGLPGVGQGGGLVSLSNTMTVAATILSFNPGGNCFGSFIDSGFNISTDSTLVFTNQGSWNNLDPKLLPLADNGGPTPTMALQPDSPAIDHCATGFWPAIDQRGVARTNGPAPDTGAYELVQPLGLPGCDTESLRAAVDAGGLVIPSCDGVYLLTAPLVITRDVTIDASSRLVVLSGGRGARVFHVNPGVALNLIHITIKDGFSTNGAGIYNDGGVVTLIDCVLATNRAVGLPGANGPDAPQDGSRLRGGDGSPGTDGHGGAIYNVGTVCITNTMFYGNSAEGGTGGNGGRGGDSLGFYNPFPRCQSFGPGGGGNGTNGGNGFGGVIYNVGDVFMSKVSADGNRASGGKGGSGGSVGGAACFIISPWGPAGNGGHGGVSHGGVICNEGRLNLQLCGLFNNGASGGNGGIGGTEPGSSFPRGAYGVSGQGTGAAIFNSGTSTLVNATVALNTAMGGECADGIGGAFDNTGLIFATNGTIWANTASGGLASNGCPVSGGSIGASIRTLDGALTLLANTIIGGPTSAGNCVGAIADAGHNICSDASAAFSAPGSLNSTDPKLGPLADNGGPTRTISLEPGSPALDAGDSAQCPPTDQRGVSRPVGSACDIGAFEGTDGIHYPTLVQSFMPAVILAGTPSTLRLRLSNTSSRLMSNISFTNRLPALVIVAPTPNVHADCSGSVAVSEGIIGVSGVNLLPQQSCSISVDVSGLISGSYTNFIGPVFSTESGPAPASALAILVVDAPPVTITDPASNKSGTGATLNARVNPNGFATTVYFEFGSTTNYGTRTPVQTVGNGRLLMPVATPMVGLISATGYHFRIVATSDLGTSFGPDQFLLTLGPGPGTGVSLDGVDDYVATPEMRNSFTNETVTIEVWFRARAPGTIVRERYNPPPINGLWNDPQIELLASGEVVVSVSGVQASVSLGTTTFEAWHHAVLRYDKATTNLDGFLDGVEAATDAKGDRDAPWEYGYPLYYAFGLGDWPVQPWVGFFRGELGEVRIWNIARTADEIRTNLYRHLSGSEPGLVCYWRLDEGMGTNAVDGSAHGNTGSLANGVTWVLTTGAPLVTTHPAAQITRGGATLNGIINPSATETLGYFEYGLTTNYGARTEAQNLGTGAEGLAFGDRISELASSAVYHFRAIASNAFGSVSGADESFVTLPPPPVAAVHLDGADDYILTPNLTNFFPNKNLTLEILFRALGPGVLIDERGQLPPTNGWQDTQLEIVATGEVKARVWALPAVTLGTASFGNWHHAALRYDQASTNLDGFLDGVEAATDVQGERSVPWDWGYALFYAFGHGDSTHMGSGAYFPGEIGEVRIWNTARTAEQIRTNLNRRLTGTEPGLICYWRFEEGMGLTAADLSGHGNNGSLTGGVQWVPSTEAPLVTTRTANDFTSNSAVLRAAVNPNEAETTMFFEWGSTTDYGSRTASQDVGTGVDDVPAESAVANLTPGSVYHCRAVAGNRFGTNYGNDRLFFTLASAPGVSVGLNGVSGFIFTPNLQPSFSSATVTIELWFNAISAGVIIDERGQSFSTPGWQDSQMEILPSGEVKVRVWNLTPISIGNASFGDWHHAVVRYNRDESKLDGFLDGAASTQTSFGDRSAPWTSGNGLYYGFGLGDSANLGTGAFLKGQLDEIRIWNTARTEAEIGSNIVRRLTGTEPGLVCYLRLDDRTGTVAYDGSGHGYHATLVGGAAWVTGPGPVDTPPGISWLASGQVRLDFIGLAGDTYLLQATTDLINWSLVATNQALSSGFVQFIDAHATNYPHRFYRIVTP